MRAVAAALSFFLSLAAAVGASAADAAATSSSATVAGDVALLRGAEAPGDLATDANPDRQGRSEQPQARPSTARAEPSVRYTAAPASYVETAPREPSDGPIWAGEFPSAVSGAASGDRARVEFLRRGPSSFSDPVSGEALRHGAFGQIGRGAYRLPSVDGPGAIGSAMWAARPRERSRRKDQIPVAEISWAVIVLLGLIMGRSLVRSMRRSRAKRAPAA